MSLHWLHGYSVSTTPKYCYLIFLLRLWLKTEYLDYITAEQSTSSWTHLVSNLYIPSELYFFSQFVNEQFCLLSLTQTVKLILVSQLTYIFVLSFKFFPWCQYIRSSVTGLGTWFMVLMQCCLLTFTRTTRTVAILLQCQCLLCNAFSANRPAIRTIDYCLQAECLGRTGVVCYLISLFGVRFAFTVDFLRPKNLLLRLAFELYAAWRHITRCGTLVSIYPFTVYTLCNSLLTLPRLSLHVVSQEDIFSVK